jgi:hypothetical protein
MTDMFNTGGSLSNANYNALLAGWSSRAVQPNVPFNAGNSNYTTGVPTTNRAILTGGANLWTITNDVQI